MSEPITEDGSSSHMSQEDALVFKYDDEDADEDVVIREETRVESPTVEESTAESLETATETPLFCPDGEGYFHIFAKHDLCESQRTLAEFVAIHSTKVTVVGLFGKEKSLDSNKAVEIFDQLAQRDIFSVLHSSSGDVKIEGFHDALNNRIYLNLRSHSSKDLEFAKLLLFLFHVSHIVICYHPGHVLDQTYLRLFQCLDAAKTKLSSTLSKKLKDRKKIPKWWSSYARPCSPRLIFYFSTCPLDLRGEKGLSEIIKKSGKMSKHPPLRRLEFSIEDQIHRIFKRAKITQSTSSLFNLPTKDNYVYVNNGSGNNIGETVHDALAHFFNTVEMSRSYGNEEKIVGGNEFVPNFYQLTVKDAHDYNGQRSFGSFLMNHLDTMIQRGPDNVEGSKYTSELPTAEQWYSAMTSVFDLIVKDASQIEPVMTTLTNYIDVDARFSESRCAKALPLAFAAYKDGLQSHYLAEIHETKLLQAMSVYSVQARGEASKKYAEMLLEECTNYWMTNRQMCEELSLTGNHCVNRRHQISSSSSGDDKLPTMPHRSSVTFASACNCGKKQGTREDPFNLADANFTFYNDLEDECCRDLERTPVPIHVNLNENTEEEGKLQSLANLVHKSEGVSYMLTRDCDPTTLPTFPSWALTHIGASTIYSHSSGVNQQGFLPGTRNLHAWDVPLKKVNFKALQIKYPSLAENVMKRASFNPQRKGVELGITAKLFLGMEYECPRGHRFIAGSLDKAVKTAKDGGSGSKFVNNDVPLYLGCPCRGAGSRPLVAQLMRIHVVTPKAPIKVMFQPVVVPCPNGPEFHPGWKECPSMPVHSYWILRLPFIYCGKEGSHLPPNEVPALSYAKLAKGCIQVVEEEMTLD